MRTVIGALAAIAERDAVTGKKIVELLTKITKQLDSLIVTAEESQGVMYDCEAKLDSINNKQQPTKGGKQ